MVFFEAGVAREQKSAATSETGRDGEGTKINHDRVLLTTLQACTYVR